MDALVALLIRLLEALFAIGWIGSVLVILLSGVEDVATVFESDPEPDTGEPTLPPTSEHL